MIKRFVLIVFVFIFIKGIAQETGEVKDSRNGKIYKTIKIGDQTWFAENLAYKACFGCWVYDNNKSNVSKCGYLYNLKTSKKVCPDGWHLPSDDEWNILANNYGGNDSAGAKLKDTTGWSNESGNFANNISGFNAFPGGFYNPTIKKYEQIGKFGYWWTSSVVEEPWENEEEDEHLGIKEEHDPLGIFLSFDNERVIHSTLHKTLGCSVRCVKDK